MFCTNQQLLLMIENAILQSFCQVTPCCYHMVLSASRQEKPNSVLWLATEWVGTGNFSHSCIPYSKSFIGQGHLNQSTGYWPWSLEQVYQPQLCLIILVDGYFIHIITFSQENTSKLNMSTSVIYDTITEEICYN